MVFALALLGLQDAIIKLTSSSVSIWQFQLLRSAFNLSLVAIVAIVMQTDLRRLPPKRFLPVAARSLFLVGAMLCFFSGVPFLSLAEIAAGLYLFPLVVTLLSRFVLGEPVGMQRLSAVAVGFCGSMLILKPGAADFKAVSLLPICAGFFYACMVLITRKLCREESPLTLATGVALAFMSVGLVGLSIFPAPAAAGPMGAAWPYLLTGWHDLAPITWAAIITCSCLNLAANVSLARAYQRAESSWLAPYDYSYLVFATFWGYAIWGTIPDALTIAGMVLIAATGIFIAWRTARKMRQPG